MIIKKIRRRISNAVDESLQNFPAKIQQILSARGIADQSELDYGLSGLIPPQELLNVDIAAKHIKTALEDNSSILIIGDFDADGATSTAIMLKALKSFGVKTVDFLVPDRFKFGYGLSVKLVEFAATKNPDLIITVDNGIANIEGVERANELGVQVIITDHHLAADRLPDALTIVNPNQPGDSFPSKNLAGVGVAFYLMLVLRQLLRDAGWFEQQGMSEPNLAELLDIVALGTVADVVILDKNNRILVEQGLRRIRQGLACPGVLALLQLAKRDYRTCQASDLGFSIGPRLNAAGRLDDMSIGINCLMATSLEQAIPIANKLDQLNRSRQNIESDMLIQAEEDLTEFLNQNPDATREESRPAALCLFDPKWHQGVIGILASRVKEKVNRPVIVFALDEESAIPVIKGSARSVKGIHIRDVLAKVDGENPGLIEKFGGHAMAAGLSLRQQDFAKFSSSFCEAVAEQLKTQPIEDEIISDGELTSNELSLDFAQLLRTVGPWGQGFPEPLFDDQFKVVNARIVGENHLKLIVEKEGVKADAIYFRCPMELRASAGQLVSLAYRLNINEFRGAQTVQLMVEQLIIEN